MTDAAHRLVAALKRQTSRFYALVKAHRLFSVVIALGALVRFIAMMGYRPVMWFNDSFDYVYGSIHVYPHPIRPSGYSLFLWLLKPFHSFALVVAIQHLMGLAMAVMIYALLRKRFGLPAWGAALATVPLLFNAYQIQLEQLILSDVPFTFFLVSVITLLLWHGSAITWKAGAAAGLLLGLATLTRSVGLPVLAAVLLYFLVRRINWRVIAATVALCALPLFAYAGWFKAEHGKFGLTESSGIFLYARVSALPPDCAKIKPPVEELPLCKSPENKLEFSQDEIWNRNSALHRYQTDRFHRVTNKAAGDFAKRAIIAQPGDYARVVAGDFGRVFYWNRSVFPDYKTYAMYEFGEKGAALPDWRMNRDLTAASAARTYEGSNPRTRVIEPYAGFMRVYQDIFNFRGTMLGIVLLAGLAAVIPRWRRSKEGEDSWRDWGSAALLPWITAVGLLLVPAATAEFDYRYVLPTVPLACLAAAMAFTEDSRRRLSALFRRDRSPAPDEAPTEAPEPART